MNLPSLSSSSSSRFDDFRREEEVVTESVRDRVLVGVESSVSRRLSDLPASDPFFADRPELNFGIAAELAISIGLTAMFWRKWLCCIHSSRRRQGREIRIAEATESSKMDMQARENGVQGWDHADVLCCFAGRDPQFVWLGTGRSPNSRFYGESTPTVQATRLTLQRYQNNYLGRFGL